MSPRFVSIDRDTPLLLPPNLRLSAGRSSGSFHPRRRRGARPAPGEGQHPRTGSEQYPPPILLRLLLYSYATGTFGSRRIEQSTYDSVPVRLPTANTHPDHDTLCTFRREHQALLAESFVKVLQQTQQLKVLQFGQPPVAADVTEMLTQASKHSAVSTSAPGT